MNQLSPKDLNIIENLMEKSSDAYDSGNVDASFDYLVEAYDKIPEPKLTYGDSYNQCSYILDFILEENHDIDSAIDWLNKLRAIAEHQGNREGSYDFFAGKTHFRLGKFEQAKKDFDKCVEIGRGMRYFEDEAPEYKDFYLHPEKYMK